MSTTTGKLCLFKCRNLGRSASLQCGTPKRQGVWHHAKILPYGTIPMDAYYVRTKFQRFTSDPPHSFFKKLVVSTPRRVRNLHTLSLAKAAPNVLKDRECKKIALREPFWFQMYQKQRYGATSSYLALWYARGFSHSCGICLRCNWEERVF